ncbi:MAG: V-type ATP synthase subunit D [Chlamydiae bacterium]|nr:MAG: V-type ATP synthase subunit D [Chlamydiota bacterium]
MAEIKLTKMELRTQQLKLEQLRKYLPTLQMKKSMLQLEVSHAALEIDRLISHLGVKQERMQKYAQLFTDPSFDRLLTATQMQNREVLYDNIAGINVPKLGEIDFEKPQYFLFDTPLWFESVLNDIRDLIIAREKVQVAKQKKQVLERELKEVSIRVNLFEKILIPRAQGNIRKIKIFLSDQQLAAVSQAKIAKKKMHQRSLEVNV